MEAGLKGTFNAPDGNSYPAQVEGPAVGDGLVMLRIAYPKWKVKAAHTRGLKGIEKMRHVARLQAVKAKPEGGEEIAIVPAASYVPDGND